VAARPQEPDPARPGQFLPPTVMFTDMTGTLFRGAVDGEARVVLSEPARYRLYVKAADVRLEDVARHHNLGNGSKLEGTAQGRVGGGGHGGGVRQVRVLHDLVADVAAVADDPVRGRVGVRQREAVPDRGDPRAGREDEVRPARGAVRHRPVQGGGRAGQAAGR